MRTGFLAEADRVGLVTGSDSNDRPLAASSPTYMLCDLTRVLFIPQRGYEEPWLSDLRGALGASAKLDTFDVNGAVAGQFDRVDVVVDQGGHGTKEMIDAAASAGVRLWQVLGTGLDHTEVGRILASGMPLANTPGQFNATALAEHALLLMLCLARRLRTAERNVKAGDFFAPMVDELGGQTLGLVGLGASGRELARRAASAGHDGDRRRVRNN